MSFSVYSLDQGKNIYDFPNSPLDPVTQKQVRADLEKQFFALIEEGNMDELKAYLNQSPDLIAIQDFFGNTPLHKAVQHMDMEKIRLFCKWGADLHAKNKEWQTPLHALAFRKKHNDKTEDEYIQILEALIQRGAHLRECDKYDHNLFDLAVRYKSYPLMSVLVNSYQFDPQRIPKSGFFPLLNAIRNDDEKAIKFLYDCGVDINTPFNDVKSGIIRKKRTPFEYAIQEERSKAALTLLALGCEPKGCSETFHPLFDAVRKGWNEVVLDLLQKGYSAAIVHRGWTPYLYAQLRQKWIEEEMAKRSKPIVPGATFCSFYEGKKEEPFIELQRSKDLVELLKNYDCGISEQFLSTKLIMLRFSIDGCLKRENKPLTQGLRTALMPKVVHQNMVQSLKHFFQSEHSKDLFPLQKECILEAFGKISERCLDQLNGIKDSEFILTPLHDGELVLAPTSWPGHRVGIVLMQRNKEMLFMKANRGNGCGDRPGVRVFMMTKLFDKKALEILGSTCTKEDFNQTIDEYLELKPLIDLPMPYQDTGNCLWASHEAMLLGAIFAVLYQDRGTQSLETIKEKASQIYNAWEIQDRTEALRAHFDSLCSSPQSLIQQDLFLLAAILIGFKGSSDVKEKVQQMLLRRSMDWKQTDDEGQNLLHYAAKKGDLSFLEWVIKNQIPLSLDSKDNKGKTPLHLSIEKGHLLFSTRLVETGMNLEEEDEEGHTPLSRSIFLKDFACFQMLLNHQADYNRKGKLGTPLEIAICGNESDSMSSFINELMKRKAIITNPLLMVELIHPSFS